MDEDKRVTASDILFMNVYQISEDMIQATYRLVEDLSKFENAFSNMAKKLATINDNMQAHILKHKWVKGADKKRCQAKVSQSKELIAICNSYAKSCHETANNLIAITEKFESNKKIKNIIKNLIEKIEDEANKIKEEEENNKGSTGEDDED